jgi:hypothetical protein
VAVDEARQHRLVFEVDDLVLRRGRGCVAGLHGHDAVFVHHQGLLAQQAATAHIEQTPAVQIGFLGQRRRASKP